MCVCVCVCVSIAPAFCHPLLLGDTAWWLSEGTLSLSPQDSTAHQCVHGQSRCCKEETRRCVLHRVGTAVIMAMSSVCVCVCVCVCVVCVLCVCVCVVCVLCVCVLCVCCVCVLCVCVLCVCVCVCVCVCTQTDFVGSARAKGCAILPFILHPTERFSTMKIKSLEDIKEEREKQTHNAHMSAGKWKKGVPVSPTLVMPSTVFHPGMQSWMGNSRRPHQQGNPFKFVAKPTLNNQSPPKTVETPTQAAQSPPKVVKSPQKAVKAFPEAAKLSTVTAAHEPMASETSASVEARQAKSAMSSDARRLKSPSTRSQTQVSVTVLVTGQKHCLMVVSSLLPLTGYTGPTGQEAFLIRHKCDSY